MKKIIIISSLTILFLIPVMLYGQTTYDKKQDKRTDTLSFAIVRMLALIQSQDDIIKVQNIKIQVMENDIRELKAGLIVTNNNIEEMKKMIVPFNKITYTPPLKGIVDEKFPNMFTVWLDIELLKQMLGL